MTLVFRSLASILPRETAGPSFCTNGAAALTARIWTAYQTKCGATVIAHLSQIPSFIVGFYTSYPAIRIARLVLSCFANRTHNLEGWISQFHSVFTPVTVSHGDACPS